MIHLLKAQGVSDNINGDIIENSKGVSTKKLCLLVKMVVSDEMLVYLGVTFE